MAGYFPDISWEESINEDLVSRILLDSCDASTVDGRSQVGGLYLYEIGRPDVGLAAVGEPAGSRAPMKVPPSILCA
jgi:hypothetical protein